MKYIYSQLSSDSVMQLINSHYSLPVSMSCKFYILGLHDNYLIEYENTKYIFRLYRNNWRTEEEILFEIELLTYLHNKSANVAAPIPTKNSRFIISTESPEGTRIGALFNYADGSALTNDISPEVCKLLGSSVAKIHQKSQYFDSRYTRPILNISYLVDQSLTQIKPYLSVSQFKYLKNIRAKLINPISQLKSDKPYFGICVGDINVSNIHINEFDKITHFDFDQCGYGHRAFEIGKFSSSLHNDNLKKERMLAFIKGYEQIRKLTEIEKRAIPYFELASLIWVMSIHVSNADRIGYKYLEKDFWTRRINKIETLDSNLV